MNKTIKIIITAVVVAAILGGIYFFSKKDIENDVQRTESELATTTENITLTGPATTSSSVATVIPAVEVNSPAPSINTPSSGLATYKGQFFPFEFSYPKGLNSVVNPQPSTTDLETKKFRFNRLSFDGSFGGYLSFYVNKADSEKYDELVKTDPNSYSTVEINGTDFYKHLAKEGKGYKVEYITFKKNIKYRFSLIVVNGEEKDLKMEVYQPEMDMILNIVKSLKIY